MIVKVQINVKIFFFTKTKKPFCLKENQFKKISIKGFLQNITVCFISQTYVYYNVTQHNFVLKKFNAIYLKIIAE